MSGLVFQIRCMLEPCLADEVEKLEAEIRELLVMLGRGAHE